MTDPLPDRKVDSGQTPWIHSEELTNIVSEYRTIIKKPSSSSFRSNTATALKNLF